MRLLDTNVLIYALNADAPQHPVSRAVVEAAMSGTLAAAVVPQVLLEFYAVVTNPRRVERPLSPEQAWGQVEVFRSSLPVLDAGPKSLETLAELVRLRCPTGGDVFDLFLVAQMWASGLSTICTYDVTAFSGIPGLIVETPEELARSLGLDAGQGSGLG